MTVDEIKAAVKKLQRMAGYEETGDISDPRTLSVVKRKRCGMADFGPSDNARRKRRYALQGTSWKKTVSLNPVDSSLYFPSCLLWN